MRKIKTCLPQTSSDDETRPSADDATAYVDFHAEGNAEEEPDEEGTSVYEHHRLTVDSGQKPMRIDKFRS